MFVFIFNLAFYVIYNRHKIVVRWCRTYWMATEQFVASVMLNSILHGSLCCMNGQWWWLNENQSNSTAAGYWLSWVSEKSNEFVMLCILLCRRLWKITLDPWSVVQTPQFCATYVEMKGEYLKKSTKAIKLNALGETYIQRSFSWYSVFFFW
jgi:hypothetical protein